MLGDVLDGTPRAVRSSNNELARGVRHGLGAADLCCLFAIVLGARSVEHTCLALPPKDAPDRLEAHQAVVGATEPDGASFQPILHAVALRLHIKVAFGLAAVPELRDWSGPRVCAVSHATHHARRHECYALPT